MSDAVGNVTHDLILPRNCTIPDENGCNDRSGRIQSPHAAQVRSISLLPQHQRSLSFHFTTRHIESHQFALKTVCSHSKYYGLHKKSNNYRNNSERVYTTNCHLNTDSKFTSRRVFSWIMRNHKISKPVFTLLYYFEKKSQIYFRFRRKDVYYLNYYWRVYAVKVTFYCCRQKQLPAMSALATRDPVRTKVYKPSDSDQFNSGLARLKICIL